MYLWLYWSGLPSPAPGDLNPGIEARSPTLQADCLPFEPPGKPSDPSPHPFGDDRFSRCQTFWSFKVHFFPLPSVGWTNGSDRTRNGQRLGLLPTSQSNVHLPPFLILRSLLPPLPSSIQGGQLLCHTLDLLRVEGDVPGFSEYQRLSTRCWWSLRMWWSLFW